MFSPSQTRPFESGLFYCYCQVPQVLWSLPSKRHRRLSNARFQVLENEKDRKEAELRRRESSVGSTSASITGSWERESFSTCSSSSSRWRSFFSLCYNASFPSFYLFLACLLLPVFRHELTILLRGFFADTVIAKVSRKSYVVWDPWSQLILFPSFGQMAPKIESFEVRKGNFVIYMSLFIVFFALFCRL